MKKTLNILFHQSLPFLVLAIIVVYSYAHFSLMPYIYFDFDPNGIIYLHSPPTQNDQLMSGDKLLQIGSVRLTDFQSDRTLRLLDGVTKGDIIPLKIERNGQNMTILYMYPGATPALILERLNSTWWIPYVFWLLGTLTYLFIRPRNTQWWLLIALNFLTAIWIATGGGPSSAHIWGASFVFSGTLWLCLPVYLHLHWVFPKSFGKFPALIIYFLVLGLILLDWFRILPRNSHLIGFLLSILGSLGLLIAHAILQPEERGSLRQLARLISAVLLPIIIVTVNGLLGGDTRYVALALIGLPLLPAAYIYAIYRHQLGELEVRANRLIILYLYMAALVTAASVLITLITSVTSSLNFPGSVVVISLFVVVLSGLATVLWFTQFERFVERRILRIPLPPASLIQSYALEIATKLDMAGLAERLTNQVMPSLLIRQSTIVYYDIFQLGSPYGSGNLSVLFNLEVDDLPSANEVPILLDQANKYRLTEEQGGNPTPCPWARVVLPLRLGERVIGLWLLGHRDPDNFYSQTEIPILNALAAQTAVALTNILQSQNLHALYQFSIDQQEQERNKLALELHDDVLNQIGLLGMYVDDDGVAPQFFEVYDKLTERFREAIHGLRPVMLNYGLQTAFTELADDMSKRLPDSIIVKNELPTCHVRYPTKVERHLYRIVQQATENALKHAKANVIRIHGSLQPAHIQIVIEDDGIGMPADKPIDLSYLLQRKHFGLAGMFERAELIGAKMKVLSGYQKGTQIFLTWIPKSNQKG